MDVAGLLLELYGRIPVRPESPAVLAQYVDAAHERACDLVARVSPGVRLVSIADGCLQHAGQAAYVRGLLRP